jgi:hypothetical protein
MSGVAVGFPSSPPARPRNSIEDTHTTQIVTMCYKTLRFTLKFHKRTNLYTKCFLFYKLIEPGERIIFPPTSVSLFFIIRVVVAVEEAPSASTD